ncbi:helix-turn-helix domain-containing protein [Actinomadura sp. SCN-SB]|uniref:helix-turn-helix domain-containing protein n=1 Tax=Actinomadura sp. SCN-SB TaxID=3373092 RepID=UPI0037535892
MTGNPRLYNVEEVAELLGLHVKTVRGYVRDGRLKATRIGKRYRIAADDLAAFTGRPVGATARESARRVRRAEATAIVQVDAASPDLVHRLSVVLGAAVTASARDGERLHTESLYDEERAALKIIVLGGPRPVAEALRLLGAMIEDSREEPS